MSSARGRRLVFGSLLVFAFLVSAHHCVGMTIPGVASWLLAPAAWAALALLFLGCVTSWVRRVHERAAAIGILTVMTATAHAEMAVRHVEMAGACIVMVGAVFSAGLVADLLGDPKDHATRRRHAHEAMCGVYAAGLCLAAGAKLYHSGITWVDGERHAYMILERTFASTSASDGLRRWLAEHPGLLTLGASYTLFIEGAAAVFLAPDLRKIFAWAVLPLPLGLLFIFGFVHPELFVIPWVLAHGGVDDELGQVATPAEGVL